MQNEWQYVQQVVADTAPVLSPLEEVIQTHVLPALLGVPLVEIDGDYHQLLPHSVTLGGLAIRNTVDTALSVHKASLAATRHLTVSLVPRSGGSSYVRHQSRRVGLNGSTPE